MSELPQCLAPLASEPRAVGWRWENVPGKEKPTKIPYQVNGAKASSNDPSTWATFTEICAAMQVQRFDGVGIQLLNLPGFAALDLDNVRNPATGELSSWAGRLCAACNSYTEVTPSGTGVRIIGAVSPEHAPMHTRKSHPEGGEIEFFVQPNTGRFITVTGDKLPEAPDVLAKIDEQIGRVYSHVVTRAERSVPTGVSDPWGPQVSDEQAMIFVLGSQAVADAFNNVGVTDPSEARYPVICSLAKATNGHMAQARKLFEGSPLVQQNDPAKAMRDFDNHSWPKAYGRGLAEHQQAAQAAAHGAQIASGLAQPASGQGGANSSLIIRPMSEVKMSRVEYLWKGWVPFGYITLAAGETGAAKSTAVADIAAKTSNGQPFPGEDEGRPPAKVLWLGSEDGIEDMTVPRLTANGANLHNIIEVRGVNRNGVRSTFSMQDDIVAVSEILKDGIARKDPFKLIVIDPITSYLAGTKQREVKINDAGQLRAVLEPWLIVAQEYKIAIICITHFMKDTNRSMLHRVLGSAAFGETCRSLIAFVERKNDQQPFAKSMIQVKTNLPEHPGGAWLFETVKVQVGADEDNGKPIFATKPAWDRIDALVDMENSTAKSGAYSDSAVGFAVWITSYFKNIPEDTGIEVAKIKAEAIGQNVITEKNWEKFSPAYLEKRNIGGVWQCRPRVR